MADDLVLTESERALIIQRREDEKKAAEARASRRSALRVAADYEAWLQDNGRGSTFSTFVNEFGYDEAGAGDVFRRVETIRQVAG